MSADKQKFIRRLAIGLVVLSILIVLSIGLITIQIGTLSDYRVWLTPALAVFVVFVSSGTTLAAVHFSGKAKGASLERLQIFIDHMPLGCSLRNKDFEIIDCNQAVLDLFGLVNKKEYFTRWRDLVPEYQPDGMLSSELLKRNMKLALETGRSCFEWMLKKVDGTPIPGETTIIRVKWQDEENVVVFVRDMTDIYNYRETERIMQRAQIAEESNRAKSMFIANMSHEIRTPMNSILGYSELALDNAIPDITRDYLQRIVINTKLLLNIINDVLDLSKIESGNLELEEIPFNIREVMEHCRSLLIPSATAKGIALDLKVDVLERKNFLGDPTKLVQICINILSNSIKFTNSGLVMCAVTQIASTDKDCTLKFEFKDTGIGMTAEQLDYIFEPFVQADSSTTRKHGGTGLGLAITKRLIEAMGSQLTVDVALGFGCKFGFTITLPTAQVDTDNTNSYLDETAAIDKPRFNKGEVLVADDNDMNLGVACEHLRRVGLVSYVAENGREAVELVRRRMDDGKEPFDLIFMDMHMPEMDGREAASIISGFNLNTPIIAMTAETMALNDDTPYKAYGMQGCLSKPFTAQELWRCLLKYLNPAK